ncbi:hypothetical protein, conserved [Trypanosoma brucei brucei TREU927]|uniref:ubiquitinyl hydrolase 1 n=1 Tax=Trypanosoma brucei brucei (strain 927/4 GUTat10.1) TaxID=185431 RepID=Q57U46_TRYB2|nr:hypothetical protein, conserved [Trypanosoma brucei brucei TREU927]AAX70872.1 hypothetical protein, conserved [Trypanosoma brucei]AAZ13558.1 hypothetical protein, conserved [Trypanosoma brucei brucei TREU927]
MRIEVKFARRTIVICLDDGPPPPLLRDLKQELYTQTGVQPAMQKLLGKPKLNNPANDSASLDSLGVGDITKLMLVGSTAKDIVAANSASTAEDRRQEEVHGQMLHNVVRNTWLTCSFSGFMADPYVGGKGPDFEHGTVEAALLLLDVAVTRINTLGVNSMASNGAGDGSTGGPVGLQLLQTIGTEGQSAISHPLLRHLNALERQAIQRAHGVLRRCFHLTVMAKSAVNPPEVVKVVAKVVSIVNGLSVGEWVMLPGGWTGMKSHTVIYLLIQRESAEEFNVVVVNRAADGSEYHPSWQTREKIVACPFLRFDHVAGARLLDRAFWLLLLSLWMRSNAPGPRSEFVRAEVFYDVLLPWLVERPPTRSNRQSSTVSSGSLRSATEMILRSSSNEGVDAAEAEGSGSQTTLPSAVQSYGATVARNCSGSIKGAVTSLLYLLEQYGMKERAVQKSVKYALKYEFMMRAAEDLAALADRFLKSAGNWEGSDTGERQGLTTDKNFECSRVERALNELRSAGVGHTVSPISTKELFRTAHEKNIIFTNDKNIILSQEHFSNKPLLVYCGGLQDPASARFSTLLAEAVDQFRLSSPQVELLFLSCDDTKERYERHIAMFSFARAAYPCDVLVRKLYVTEVPKLLLFGPDGRLLHRRGVDALRADPSATLFPHGGLWNGAMPLTATDVAILKSGAAVLAHHTRKRLAITNSAISERDGFIPVGEARRVLRILSAVCTMVELIPKEPNIAEGFLIQNTTKNDVHNNMIEGVATPQTQKDAALVGQLFTLSDIVEGNNSGGGDSSGCGGSCGRHECGVPMEAVAFLNGSLLPATSTEAYKGQPLRTAVPEVQSLTDLRPVTSWAQLHFTLKRAEAIIDALWLRARHSGTTSRVAIQMHIIEVISWLFLFIIPLPLPRGMDVRSVPEEERSTVAEFYTVDAFPSAPTGDGSGANGGRATDVQGGLQESIYSLMLSFTNAWQAVEVPTRAFDAERGITAMEMLVVYDAVARHTANSASSVNSRLLASMLNCDGGYYLSTSMGGRSLSFAQVSASMELVRPQMLIRRSALLRYITEQQRRCAHELFDLPMTDKLEVRKNSVTVGFLRKLLDNCGYRLAETSGPSMFTAAGGSGGSEMEQLMQWFCSARSPLARDHPEFGQLRDMVLLTKFLVTMEMRDAQLLRRRRQPDGDGGGRGATTWRLTFDADTPGSQMSAGWRTKPMPPHWECMLVRGRDSDIADIVVTGFGGRELLYGEGLVLHSPIDVGVMLGIESATEDDVLHAVASKLPTFGGAMSAEESEVLLSCLTAPYLRLPLVLNFFASQSHHTYLFNAAVQSLFRAALFEPGAFTTQQQQSQLEPELVPMRLNRRQREEIEQRRLIGDLSAVNYEACLGTPYGLLLNELQHSPDAVLVPLHRILVGIEDIGPSSVYSANASYVLFIVGVVCDVLAFCNLARELRDRELSGDGAAPGAVRDVLTSFVTTVLQFLVEIVRPMLLLWCTEGEENDDTPTQCVVHSYMASIHRAAWKYIVPTTSSNSPLSPTALSSSNHLTSLLQSCCFVRARHSFGLGMQRTQVAMQEGDKLLTPREQLLRFLQAQGLDTADISHDALEESQRLMLSGGRRRAVFVQIRSAYHRDTIRVPNLYRSDARNTTESKQLKLPPADVPENVIFGYLLEDHKDVLHFFSSIGAEQMSVVFKLIVHTVLRDHTQGRGSRRMEEKKVRSNNCENAVGTEGNAEVSGGIAPTPTFPRHGTKNEVVPQPVNEDHAELSAVSVVRGGDGHLGESWKQTSPGVYRGPVSTGLVFHAHTCELFWRNDELKPVPDSMSHFSDFKTIIGNDVLQCGLVSRSRNYHWVHIVGTPFDVVEWTPHDPLDQGVGAPLVLSGELPKEPVTSASFDGLMFNRPVDVYDEVPWLNQSERWAVDLLRAVLRYKYSANDMKYFPVAQAESPSAPLHQNNDGKEVRKGKGDGVRVMRFIMNDGPQYTDEDNRATWKEIVAYRLPSPHLHVFNLVPHARRVYRSLVFTSNQRWCLHSLPPITGPRPHDQLHLLAFQAGELDRRVQCEGSIEIHRYNSELGMREMYVPAQLLQGVLPSVLLEVFLFWQDEEDNIRGYSTADAQDYWFNYTLFVRLRSGKGVGAKGGILHNFRGGEWECVVTRRNNTQKYCANARKRPRSRSTAASEVDGKHQKQLSPQWENEEEAGTAAAEQHITDAQVSLMHSSLTFLTATACRTLLQRTKGDIHSAISYALDPANQDDVMLLVSTEQRKESESEGDEEETEQPCISKERRHRGHSGNNAGEELTLLNLTQSARLFPLLHLLTRLEDCSHILLWGRVNSKDGSSRRCQRGREDRRRCEENEEEGIDKCSVADVVLIELPRLCITFYPHVDTATGSLRLHLADHPGWYIAEATDYISGVQNFLPQLQEPFQQYVTLCNSTAGFALMVPNHDFTPMVVSDDPFNKLLLFDRSSLRWKERVASTFYLYTVHPCRSFLVPPSLAASLYYVVLQCATGHYAAAMRTLESCYTDSTFTTEECFMFTLMGRTLDDQHPDAHAVRLKLAHAVLYGPQKPQWPLHTEVAAYLQKKRHVSRACQLTREELIDLMRRCNRSLPIVHAQLQLWAALEKEEEKLRLSNDTDADTNVVPSPETVVRLDTPLMHRCGQPWERLLLYQWTHISSQRPRRITYKVLDEKALEDEELVKFIWKDTLLSDEESGGNSRLGFYFLYSLKQGGTAQPKLAGEDVRVTLCQLLTRWFHLRHSRWGREEQQDGEAESRPSWCGAVLQLMDIHPEAGWPAPPNSRHLLHRMNNGVSVVETREVDESESVVALMDRPSPELVEFYRKVEQVACNLHGNSQVVQQRRGDLLLSIAVTSARRVAHVHMRDHLQPRIVPSNTAMECLQVSFGSLLSAVPNVSRDDGVGKDAEEEHDKLMSAGNPWYRRLTALFGAPLSDMPCSAHLICTEQLTHEDDPGDGRCGDCLPQLPFDLRKLPRCNTPLAKNMLDRLEADVGNFAMKQRQCLSRTLTAFSQERLYAILRSRSTIFATRQVYAEVTCELQRCIDELSALAASDEALVHELTASILHSANDVCRSDCADEDAPGDEEDLLRACDYQLQRIKGDQCPVPLEWLLCSLLSTEMDADLQAVNPFHGGTKLLQAQLLLLTVLTNRCHIAQQAKQAVRQVVLFLELCALLRGMDDGCKYEASATRSFPVSHCGDDMGVMECHDASISWLQELLQLFSIGVDVDMLFKGEGQSTDGNLQLNKGSNTSSHNGLCCRCLPEDLLQVLESRLQHLSNEVIEALTVRRYCTDLSCDGCGDSSTVVTLDPRYLMFEFIHNILLRARQVEMVRWFVQNINAGVSRVQQMIMGQGKTTVVGPLLALILADGQQLVTQVMPTALLEQTSVILRRCFSVVIPKQIYTLKFDRSFDDSDSSQVNLLKQKLTAATRKRGILISAPECVKSVFLKMIEQLHLVESVMTEYIDAEDGKVAACDTADERVAVRKQELMHRTRQRSSMADAIVPILQLWQRGVLIMDEVDVLLHPLRSELNFPIGLKHPIELSGPRWVLPMHLLDAIFFYQRRRTTTADGDAHGAFGDGHVKATAIRLEGHPAGVGEDVQNEILGRICDVIAMGYETRALQREPHLVLLDSLYYNDQLLPALLPWAQLWLYRHFQLEKHACLLGHATGLAASLGWRQFLEITTLFLKLRERPSRDSSIACVINSTFSPLGIQLLCLSHDWLHRIMPHVLSKIDRVGFGLLQERELALLSSEARDRMPLSRRTMAVPFVAKDVPSLSSEFAHPDVVIGLTVLAYRYEGMRFADMRDLLLQLKQDFVRQSGPEDHRPAAKLYTQWLRLSLSCSAETEPTSHGGGILPRVVPSEITTMGTTCVEATNDRSGIPLSQLQVTDEVALHALYLRLRRLPDVIHYYLSSHIFPRTMSFQALKISACGHELGSSMLFTRRIGFSGTPSNLLPLDLGDCFYEPGSDGRVLSVLTNPQVVTVLPLQSDWTPLRLLDQIASSRSQPFHALIDAGALITNMDNETVARYLLSRLSADLFDGVVFLDAKDRQMILQRSNGLLVPVAQSGIALNRRFTFFDQVHTTGTDIKQAATATAVLTLGKDLVFRDYAQGAYRMRGIGRGQRLCLFVIPEVLTRLNNSLGSVQTGDLLLDIPAWLLLNSVRMEGLQFIKLTTQEIANVWRKKALKYLVTDAIHADAHPDAHTEAGRCYRFDSRTRNLRPQEFLSSDSGACGGVSLPDGPLLRSSIREFREPVDFPVDSTVDTAVPFLQRLKQQMNERPQELIRAEAGVPSDGCDPQRVLTELMERLELSLTLRADGANVAVQDMVGHLMNFDSEVVHEQEAEEEQEQEAEQEEQRVSVASRDDEFQIPWRVQTLQAYGNLTNEELGNVGSKLVVKGGCFYSMQRFRLRPEQPAIMVDWKVQLSDNYFREEWHGVGERRLKNAFLFLEWSPSDTAQSDVSTGAGGCESGGSTLVPLQRVHCGLVTLAEGESLRWMMHHPSRHSGSVRMALRMVSNGCYMDASAAFAEVFPYLTAQQEGNRWELLNVPPSAPHMNSQQRCVGVLETPSAERDGAALLYRFFNNDMFFSVEELAVLGVMLKDVTHVDRLRFFTDCLRARRRHRNHWDDTPVAVLFVPPGEQMNARLLAILSIMQVRFEELQSRLCNVPPPPQLVDQLQSFHTRLNRLHLEHVVDHHHHRERVQPRDTENVLSVSAIARVLFDVFSGILKPYNLNDVLQALQYFVHRKGSTVVLTEKLHNTTVDAAAAESPFVRCVTEAFPVLNLEFLDRCLVALCAHNPAVEGPWHCSACTLLNDPTVKRCLACNTARATDTAGATGGISSDDPHGNESHGGEAEESWACQQCTFINESRRSPLCAVCLGPNPNPLPQSQPVHSSGDFMGADAGNVRGCPEGYWACLVEQGGCSKFNPNTVFYCQVCDKARPGLATLRF